MIVWDVIIANVDVAYHVSIYVPAYGDCIKKVQLAGLYLITCIRNIHDDNAWFLFWHINDIFTPGAGPYKQ